MLNFAKGAAPLYSQLQEVVRSQILNDEYQVGAALPSEQELQETYGISRITVRRALDELAREGWVTRERGRGTLVAQTRFEEPLNRIRSFTDEMRALGKEPTTLWVQVTYDLPGRAAAQALEISPDVPAVCVSRVRATDSQPLVLFKTHLNPVIPVSTDPADYNGSLYTYLETQRGVVITRVVETFEAQLMPDDVAAQLQLEPGSVCMKRIRLATDQRGRRIEYSVCYYRGDKYRYHVQIG